MYCVTLWLLPSYNMPRTLLQYATHPPTICHAPSSPPSPRRWCSSLSVVKTVVKNMCVCSLSWCILCCAFCSVYCVLSVVKTVVKNMCVWCVVCIVSSKDSSKEHVCVCMHYVSFFVLMDSVLCILWCVVCIVSSKDSSKEHVCVCMHYVSCIL